MVCQRESGVRTGKIVFSDFYELDKQEKKKKRLLKTSRLGGQECSTHGKVPHLDAPSSEPETQHTAESYCVVDLPTNDLLLGSPKRLRWRDHRGPTKLGRSLPQGQNSGGT